MVIDAHVHLFPDRLAQAIRIQFITGQCLLDGVAEFVDFFRRDAKLFGGLHIGVE